MIGYACDGFELWTLILCVQIGCMLYKTRQARITVVIRSNRISGTGCEATTPIIDVLQQVMCTHDAGKLAISVLETYKDGCTR
jgi:hypothetical protein